jgi:hypothetical protein
MAQLNLYVNDDLAARLRREARKAGVPLSRYVVELLSTTKEKGWPSGYFDKTCGFLKERFPEPEDRLPETFELPEDAH